MTNKLIACSAIALALGFAAYAARADGPGVVTTMISNGGAYPYAEQFRTGGTQWYCFLTYDKGYEGELRSETMSYATRNYTTNPEPLNFTVTASSPDCPAGSLTVNRLQLGQ